MKKYFVYSNFSELLVQIPGVMYKKTRLTFQLSQYWLNEYLAIDSFMLFITLKTCSEYIFRYYKKG